MASNPRVLELLEEMLDSGSTPEEVCRVSPELLPEVQEMWRRHRSLRAQVSALIPEPESASVGCAAPPEQSHGVLPHISGYEVQGLLGHGGMGVVQQAVKLWPMDKLSQANLARALTIKADRKEKKQK